MIEQVSTSRWRPTPSMSGDHLDTILYSSCILTGQFWDRQRLKCCGALQWHLAAPNRVALLCYPAISRYCGSTWVILAGIPCQKSLRVLRRQGNCRSSFNIHHLKDTTEESLDLICVCAILNLSLFAHHTCRHEIPREELTLRVLSLFVVLNSSLEVHLGKRYDVTLVSNK